MIDLDRLAALCDAATQGKREIEREINMYRGDYLFVKLPDGCQELIAGSLHARDADLIAALDPATVRQLIDAYKCLQRLVKIRDESEGIAIPEDNIDAIIAWKVKWDAAFTAARKIVKGE